MLLVRSLRAVEQTHLLTKTEYVLRLHLYCTVSVVFVSIALSELLSIDLVVGLCARLAFFGLSFSRPP